MAPLQQNNTMFPAAKLRAGLLGQLDAIAKSNTLWFKTVPSIPCMFRVIYTRRALDASLLFSDTLLGEHTFAASQLSRSISQVTGLGIIIVSVVVGLGLCLSLLRSYQETAGLPTTRCGALLLGAKRLTPCCSIYKT